MRSMCSIEHVKQNVGYVGCVGRPSSGAGPLTRVPTRLATGHTFDHSRLKNMASEKEGKNIRWIMSEEDNLEMFGLFCVPPYWWLLPPTLSTQMFPNLDHFVWELSVSKTSASPCVGIENPLFITLDLPSPFSQMSSHDVENTLRKMNQLESRLGKVRKSDTILEIPLFSHRCHHNGHGITYCCQNESTENH